MSSKYEVIKDFEKYNFLLILYQESLVQKKKVRIVVRLLSFDIVNLPHVRVLFPCVLMVSETINYYPILW